MLTSIPTILTLESQDLDKFGLLTQNLTSITEILTNCDLKNENVDKF